MSDWESAERVQKNDAGEYRALIGGAWIPVAKAQKNEQGQFRIMKFDQPQAQQQIQPIEPQETPSGFKQGLIDPIEAGAQLLEKITPSAIADPMNRLNNWLASKGIPLAPVPEGGVSQMAREREQQYQAQRAAAGEQGIDWARIGGNILNPANLAIASKLPQATTLLGRVGTGALGGSLFGAAQPVTEGDFWTEKAKQAGIGAATGAILPAVGEGIARVVRPKTSSQVQALMKEGVVPTPGQQVGGIAQSVEEKLTSIPIVGDVIKSAQRRGLEDFNRAGINRSLESVGQKLPKSMPVGHEAVNYAIDQVDDAYNKLLPNLSGKIDDQLSTEIGSLKTAITESNIPEPLRDQFDRIIQNEVIGRFTKEGIASGETVKQVESKLGQLAKNYFKGDYDQQAIGGAIKETQAALRRMIERSNPDYAGELSKVNSAYANLQRIKGAASALGAKEGVFTPAQLKSAVRSQDISRNKAAFAKGQALMQDLAEAGQSVLSPNIPNSGTFDRALLAWMMANPIKATGVAIASPFAGALYSRPVSALTTARPQFATPLAQAIRQSTPFLTPGIVPLSYRGFNEGP